MSKEFQRPKFKMRDLDEKYFNIEAFGFDLELVF